MTFDGRARNRYVNFSRDVVRSAERVNLNRTATPLRRVIRPAASKNPSTLRFYLEEKQRATKQAFLYSKSHYEWKGIETRRGLLIRDNYPGWVTISWKISRRMINDQLTLFAIVLFYTFNFSTNIELPAILDLTSPSLLSILWTFQFYQKDQRIDFDRRTNKKEIKFFFSLLLANFQGYCDKHGKKLVDRDLTPFPWIQTT